MWEKALFFLGDNTEKGGPETLQKKLVEQSPCQEMVRNKTIILTKLFDGGRGEEKGCNCLGAPSRN